MKIHNFEKSAMEVVTANELDYTFDETASVFLSGTQILVCGGKDPQNDSSPHNKSAVVSVSSGAIEETYEMQEARSGHAIVRIGDLVYVFGQDQTCELWGKNTEGWTSLPSMPEDMPLPTAAHVSSRIYITS
jgi:hypothetical protein